MNNHSFVIRLWLEEAETERQAEKWRGHITHYPSRRERYFDDFAAILEFIRGNTRRGRPAADPASGAPQHQDAPQHEDM